MCQAWADGGEGAFVIRQERRVSALIKAGKPISRSDVFLVQEWLAEDALSLCEDGVAHRNLLTRFPHLCAQGEG